MQASQSPGPFAIAVIGCGQLGELFVRTVPIRPVLATVMHDAGRERLRDLPAEVVVLDLLGEEPLGGQLQGIQRLVITVAPGLDRDPVPLWTRGIARLVDAADSTAHAVLISSTGVYAESSGGAVDESGRLADTPRARALLQAEAQVLEGFAHATVLRCSGLVGPGRGPHRHLGQIAGAQRADGDAWLNLVSMSDVVDLIQHALDPPLTGIFNCSGLTLRRREFYDPLLVRAGLAPVRWQASRAHSGRRVIANKVADALGFQFRKIDLARL